LQPDRRSRLIEIDRFGIGVNLQIAPNAVGAGHPSDEDERVIVYWLTR
jgi:hypothetical protein